jgi:hypothetical protein
MSYEYIRRAYGVPAQVGMRVKVDGRPGVLIQHTSHQHYLRVRFDGAAHDVNAHPTWRVEYQPAERRA